MTAKKIKVAVCGHLPTACDFLLKQGVVHTDQYDDAVEIREASDYHLILVYAPNAEGILDTVYLRDPTSDGSRDAVPIRLLNEPPCHSALLELKSIVRRISEGLTAEAAGTAET